MKLSVRVHPRSGRNAVDVAEDGAVRVRVTAAPDRGRANEAVVRLLAERLGLPKSSVRIVSGRASRVKTVQIEGLESVEDALARLRTSL